jgi:serine/threonine-protein phosphatase 2A activator
MNPPPDKRLHDEVPMVPPDAPYNGELRRAPEPPPEFRTGLRAPWATVQGAPAPPPPPPPFVPRNAAGSSSGPPSPSSVAAAGDPAVGSHFPQLARPLGPGAEARSSPPLKPPNVMSPTTAPWATAAAGPTATQRAAGAAARGASSAAAPHHHHQSGQLRTGVPVAPLVDAVRAWPAPLLSPRLAGGWELLSKSGGGAGGGGSGGGGNDGDGDDPSSLKWPTPADRDEESRLVRLLRPPATKRITCEADLRSWLLGGGAGGGSGAAAAAAGAAPAAAAPSSANNSARAFVGFVLELNAACTGRSLADPLRPAAHYMQQQQQQQVSSPQRQAATDASSAAMPPPPPHAPRLPPQEDRPSPAVAALVRALDELERLVDAHPPLKRESGQLRYGNPAYRDWHAAMSASAERLLADMLPPAFRRLAPRAAAAALGELAPYWRDSFGNATRIDYGTGHETCFVALLYCLARLGALRHDGTAGGGGAPADAAATPTPHPHRHDDAAALVGVVFARYLSLMRRVQTTYWLEPAGSHGVWGLDDYQFLPFVWGSAQLAHHPLLRPKSIHNAELMAQHGDEFLYLAAVRFVLRVKKGPLHETSPIINDISGVPTWTKVNQGLVKMYQVEVLSKFPIMQHFLFGGLLPFLEEEEGGGGGGGGMAE